MAGAYLGGALGHHPPLGRQDSIISIEKYAKLWHGPPFVTWAEGLSTKRWAKTFFWPKTGLNWSEDFGLHIILSRKTDLVLGWKIFILVFINLKFSAFPGPPPTFENPAYATGQWGS